MIEKILKKLAEFSIHRPFLMILLIIGFTGFTIMGATQLKMQTAFEKMLPQKNKIIQTLYEVRDKFGGTDIITIAIKLKDTDNPERINDIRDPSVLRLVKFLEDDLKDIDGITSVSSPVDIIIRANNNTVPEDIETVKKIYSSLPDDVKRKIFDSSFSMTIVNAFTDAGADQKKLFRVMKEVDERIEEAPIPPGVEVIATGTPPMRVLMSELMKKSQRFTTILGLIGVLIILFLYFKRPLTTIMPLIPVILGVIWTIGTMGFLGIPLDMATAGIGSLILGLGIDYGIHLLHRYNEERSSKKDVEEALEIAVISTGTAVLATTATTVVGFGALVFAPLPMMANLGKVCAMGLTYCMFAVLLFLPSLIIIEERKITPFFKKLRGWFK